MEHRSVDCRQVFWTKIWRKIYSSSRDTGSVYVTEACHRESQGFSFPLVGQARPNGLSEYWTLRLKCEEQVTHWRLCFSLSWWGFQEAVRPPPWCFSGCSPPRLPSYGTVDINRQSHEGKPFDDKRPKTWTWSWQDCTITGVHNCLNKVKSRTVQAWSSMLQSMQEILKESKTLD